MVHLIIRDLTLRISVESILWNRLDPNLCPSSILSLWKSPVFYRLDSWLPVYQTSPSLLFVPTWYSVFHVIGLIPPSFVIPQCDCHFTWRCIITFYLTFSLSVYFPNFIGPVLPQVDGSTLPAWTDFRLFITRYLSKSSSRVLVQPKTLKILPPNRPNSGLRSSGPPLTHCRVLSSLSWVWPRYTPPPI